MSGNAEKITVELNGRQIPARVGQSLLEVAAAAGITIPTLCRDSDGVSHTSCMVCLVRDLERGRLVPACTARCRAGTRFEVGDEELEATRRTALDLLLSEHVGDCLAPCELACPAHLRIPVLLRQLAAGERQVALATVLRDIALPAVLGRICDAPCEAACRRGALDQPLAICLLKRFAADSEDSVPVPEKNQSVQATIVGAGPAGLAAAWHLSRAGIGVRLLDREQRPGGALRSLNEERLPAAVLDRDVDRILKGPVHFQGGVCLGESVSLDELLQEHGVVLLATGDNGGNQVSEWGLEMSGPGLSVAARTQACSRTGVFAAGSVVRPLRSAVRAEAQGKAAAAAMGLYLAGSDQEPPRFRSVSRIHDIRREELEAALAQASPGQRIHPAAPDGGLNPGEARAEAARCLDCDCAAYDACHLRHWSEALDARQERFRPDERPLLSVQEIAAGLWFTVGKCIRCGSCVRLCADADVTYGMTWLGRGYATRVGLPFGRKQADWPPELCEDLADRCPTGALVWKGDAV